MADVTPNLREAAAEPDLAGRQLDDFLLLRRLARGAMAEVYLAEQGSLRRQVAVKVLKSDLAKDDSYVKRFHNEAHAAASLVHANIVQIYAVGCADGIHYIAQEYIQGQNLREWMSRRGPPELKHAGQIMRQVASALAKAAERGIVHRDIKPENIMLAGTGEVKVADFGLARHTSDDANMALTQIGMTMGTPLYMSPEQVEGRPLDPRSDLYSFGVTCYQMLAGVTPFRGETALSVAIAHLKTQPPRLENVRPNLPPALCRIVHKLLAKEPDRRYASARELLHELRAVQLPGEDQPWLDDLEELSPQERAALATIGAATEHLATVMKSASMPIVGRRFYGLLFVCTIVAFAAGGLLAYETRRPLLAPAAGQTTIPKLRTAEDQFTFAPNDPATREAWLKSIERYFPNDRQFVPRAQQELALYYVLQNREGDALRQFELLAAHPEPQQEAFGLAGASYIWAKRGAYDKAREALTKLSPLLDNLAERRVSVLAEKAISIVKEHGGQEKAAEWDEFSKKLKSEETEN